MRSREMVRITNYATRLRSKILPAILLSAQLAAIGCTSGAKSAADGKSGSSSGEENPAIDMSCLPTRMENPPESFHYSFKSTDGQNTVDKEADITPQTMDIIIHDNSGAHTFHGLRSNPTSWDSAILNLSGSGFTLLIARMDFIKNTSAVKRVSAEPMNGYSATQYSIDTTSGSAADTQTFKTMVGSGSYDKGRTWLTSDGCPVKLILDEVRQDASGGTKNFHFEVDVIKK